jgi:hypothetical protein
LEIGEHEHEEAPGRREGAEQHPWARAVGGTLERLRDRRAARPFFLVAVEEIDPVVDADADHERDEHDREDGQVANEQGNGAQRPQKARSKGGQHEEGGAGPAVRHE